MIPARPARSAQSFGCGRRWSDMANGENDRAGLFEVLIKERREVFPYRLRVERFDGTVETFHDPYSFLPTSGELDLHLWNEGRHEQIYEKLGAHAAKSMGCRGSRSPCGRRTRAASAWSEISMIGTGAHPHDAIARPLRESGSCSSQESVTRRALQV